MIGLNIALTGVVFVLLAVSVADTLVKNEAHILALLGVMIAYYGGSAAIVIGILIVIWC